MRQTTKKLRAHLHFSSQAKHLLEKILSNRPEESLNDGKILVDLSHRAYFRWTVDIAIIVASRGWAKKDTLVFAPDYRSIVNKKIFLVRDYLAKLTRSDAKVFRTFGKKIEINSNNAKKRAQKSFYTRENILALSYLDIPIGDLIYDTYLKDNKQATIDLENFNIEPLVAEAKQLVDSYQKMIRKNDVREIHLTHAVYLKFGILARVGLSEGCKVFVFENSRGRQVLRLSEGNPYQTPKYSDYQIYLHRLKKLESFSLLKEKAKLQLEGRILGQVDQATNYMRQSAYLPSVADQMFPDTQNGKKTIVIMLHSFFDSPHIYGEMLFADFWVWITETLDLLQNLNYTIFVKPHPNALLGEEVFINRLRAKYQAVYFLNPKISNSILASKRLDLCVTVYGTVAHEFTYLGTPVLCAGKNPHQMFEFVFTPKSKAEYFDYLAHSEKWILPENSQSNVLDYLTVEYFNDLDGRNLVWETYLGQKSKTAPPHEFSDIQSKIEELVQSTRQNFSILLEKG